MGGFTQRLIADVDDREDPLREKLWTIASFIVDSYARDPDLMKVIIVEVTRAANTFGQTHLEKIREAYIGIARIVEQAQRSGELKSRRHSSFCGVSFLWLG